MQIFSYRLLPLLSVGYLSLPLTCPAICKYTVGIVDDVLYAI